LEAPGFSLAKQRAIVVGFSHDLPELKSGSIVVRALLPLGP
jgi:hypothetical protein